MPTGQQYSTNVPQTTLTSSVNATATTFSVASSTSWPTPPFTAIVDIGLSTQEPVDVTAIVGTTWTVTRNIDGTVGFAHANAATLTHGDIGRDFREARSHIDASSSNDASGHSVHGLAVSSSVVGTTDTQTLTNKTLTSPVVNTGQLNSPAFTNTVPSGLTGTQFSVYSNGGIPTLATQAGTSVVLAPYAVGAEVNGFLAWTFDPVVGTQQASLSTGVIRFLRFYLHNTTTATNIVLPVSSSATTTANQNFAGIYNTSGTRLGQTADQSGVWNGSGVFSMAISGGPITMEPGVYYFAILPNFTAGAFTIMGTPNNTNFGAVNSLNVGLSTPLFRDMTSNSSTNTSLPASFTFSGNVTASTPMHFAAIT